MADSAIAAGASLPVPFQPDLGGMSNDRRGDINAHIVASKIARMAACAKPDTRRRYR